MLIDLTLRKFYRILKIGSPYPKDYQAYKAFLQKEPINNNAVSYFNLTVDLELGWSRVVTFGKFTTKEESLKRSRYARKNFLTLLYLNEKYNIPTTFAIVGHLAIKNCNQHNPPPYS